MSLSDDLKGRLSQAVLNTVEGVQDPRVLALAERVAHASAAIAIRELQQEDTTEDVRHLNAALANLEAVGKLKVAREAQKVVERVLTTAIEAAFAGIRVI